MITEIAFVGTPVTDMQRARAFYEDLLELEPSHEACDGQWIEYDIAGGTFAITNIEPEWKPSGQGTTAAFEVDDLDATVARLKAKGAAIAMDIFETPVCRMALVSDPDGNKLTLHQRK
jgi:predicted enzyme related to lactoylglutathione lyase